jgi:two-component system chemotaxis sensor kinase CheA
MNPLQEQFVSEARELIARASDDLIEMEREEATAARLDQVLRVFHTLKGSAGLVDLPAMTLTMHAAEDLMAGMQGAGLAAATPVITQLFDCLALISRWVDAYDAHGELPPRAGEDARVMAEQLRAHLTSAGARPAVSQSGDIPEWAARLLTVRREDIGRRLGARRPELLAVSYQPHAGCFFDGDDPVQLLRQVPNLLVLQFENAAFDQPLADLAGRLQHARHRWPGAGGENSRKPSNDADRARFGQPSGRDYLAGAGT